MRDIHSMNLAALDLNLLVALESLVEEASVSRAAEKAGLSQPAMSHALKRVRELLKDPLLVRVGPRMQLTTRGQALRQPLRDVLSGVRDLLASETFDPARSTRTFCVFASDYATDLLFPRLQRRLGELAPGISIRLQPGAGNRLDPFQLASGVDLAIACVPNCFKGFYQQRLFTDRDACVVRCGHPLRRRLSRREVFLKARHVAVVGREFSEDPVDTWLKEEGLERNIALSVPQYLQALHVIAGSDLIGVIPERLVRANAMSLGLHVLPVPLDVGTFDEYLLHPARSHADPGSVWLRGVLYQIAESLSAVGPLQKRNGLHHLPAKIALPRSARGKARFASIQNPQATWKLTKE
jgi:DNA-binding transcriptional LysR family regulator